MAKKNPSYFQTKSRERLREQCYDKREVFLPHSYAKILKDCETALRTGVMPRITRSRKETRMS